GVVDEGLAMSRRAIKLRRENGHNAHAVMHGLHEKADPEASLAFIDDWLPGYPDDALMWGHLHWHAALNELALERPDAAVARLLGVGALRALIEGASVAGEARLAGCAAVAIRIGGSHAQRQVIEETQKAMRVPVTVA